MVIFVFTSSLSYAGYRDIFFEKETAEEIRAVFYTTEKCRDAIASFYVEYLVNGSIIKQQKELQFMESFTLTGVHDIGLLIVKVHYEDVYGEECKLDTTIDSYDSEGRYSTPPYTKCFTQQSRGRKDCGYNQSRYNQGLPGRDQYSISKYKFNFL